MKGYTIAEQHGMALYGLVYVQLDSSEFNSYIKLCMLKTLLAFITPSTLTGLFFVSRNAVSLLKDEVVAALDQQRPDLAVEKMVRMFDFYKEEYRLGLHDEDKNILCNTGFIDGRPTRLDLGKLALNPQTAEYPFVYVNELSYIIDHRITQWLGRHYPEYNQEITDALHQYLNRTALPLF